MSNLFPRRFLCGAFLVASAPVWSQAPVVPFKVNPYRNFLGCWSGSMQRETDKHPTDIALTISEEPEKARMRWDFTYGHLGQKGYDTAIKYVVLSPTDQKMLTNYDREEKELFDVPDLPAFTLAGYGVLTATQNYTSHNYWHVSSKAENKAVYTLSPTTLTYVWTTSKKGQIKPYSHFEFTRCNTTP